MKKKVVIYLAALANDKFGISPATIPLECGFIKAYAMDQFPDDLEIEIFRTFRDLWDAIKIKKPDIVGCAWYGWNLWLTVNAFNYIKQRYPEVITVVGGANVPDAPGDILRDLKQFPSIEMIIPNEGEISFVNLLKVFLSGGRKTVFQTPIDGVYYLNETKDGLVNGAPVPTPKNIDIFPSPYLKGYLDKFLPSDLMPIMQTTRGCPFHCTFCVAAKDAWNKVRAFDLERVKEEIRYIDKRARNRTLRLTDENFGIIKRDLDLARFIAEYRAKTRYPAGLRVYTHKDINDRVKEMSIILKDLIPLNVSFQSMSPSVLDNIKRKNIGVDNFKSLVNWAHQQGLVVTTEIIFGLPGETYQSFMEGINRLVDFRLDSVGGGALMMLKEAPLSKESVVKEYGYRTMYGVAESGFTEYEDFRSIEIESWAVESKFFSYDEYIKYRLFAIFYGIFMFRGFFKELIYACDNRGVKIVDIVEEFLNNPGDYPYFTQRIQRLRANLEKSLYQTPQAVEEDFARKAEEATKFGKHYDHMAAYELTDVMYGEMLHPDNRGQTADEVIKSCLKVFDRTGRGSKKEFLQELEFCKQMLKAIIAPFWEEPKEVVEIESPYDLVTWFKNDYSGALTEYQLPSPGKFKFRINSHDQYVHFHKEYKEVPFHRQSKLFFETVKNNNIRRFLVASDAANPTENSFVLTAGSSD